jgi:quinol monooxygenase YgiN
MITVIAHYPAAADAVDNCSPGTRLPHATSLGCLQFDAHHGIDNPDEVALVERYESRAAFAEHRRTPHLRRTSRPNSSRCSPREAGRCSGQLCDATYDVLTPRSRDRSRRADMNRMTIQCAVPNDPERFDNR